MSRQALWLCVRVVGIIVLLAAGAGLLLSGPLASHTAAS